MNTYPHLFEPGRIGIVETKNRIVMAPMGTTGALAGYHGTFSDRVITYYERRAKGETGLIITGLNLVRPKTEPWEIDGVVHHITFDSFWKVPNFIQLTERVTMSCSTRRPIALEGPCILHRQILRRILQTFCVIR